ncbi:MAG: type V CRISPR-associated protein Cas12a/Cpf1 [Bacilli bacterium]|nr:type V CRISPR-associated protein Cas12a/Cpf1 [Bacilli bacterium]MDD4066202.1 type V CRISPR-associated protein Cas12a/Cpf1 [Bacilli bacterium]
MAIYDNMYGIYSIQKTLRFELKPIGKTKEVIDAIDIDSNSSIFVDDQRRYDEYLSAKALLDNYYRDFVNEVLSSFTFLPTDLKTAFLLYSQSNKDDSKNDNAKELVKVQTKMMKELSATFKQSSGDFGLDGYQKLFGNDQKPLNKWLKNEFEIKHSITKEEYDKAVEVSSLFGSGFVGYFNSYKKARDNLFEAEGNSASIAHRVVEDNMIIYFKNCLLFATIKEKYPDLFENINNKTIMKAEDYNDLLTQQNINQYNAIIGGDKEQKTVGLNGLLNQYRQAKNLKSRELPLFLPLFKQILSEKEGYLINDYNNDEEMLNEIKSLYNKYLSDLSSIQSLCQEYICDDNKLNIFITTKALSSMSQELTGDWSVFKSSIDSSTITYTKKKQDMYKKTISLGELQTFYDKYNQSLDEKKAPVSFISYFANYDISHIKTLYEDCIPIFESKTICLQEMLSPKERVVKKDEEKIVKLKTLLDHMIEIIHHYKPLLLVENHKQIELKDEDVDFRTQFDELYSHLNDVFFLYNRVRNYITQVKDNKKEKIRQYFDCSSLLVSWGCSFNNNDCALFKKGNLYYFAKCLCKISDVSLGKLFNAQNKGDAFYYKYFQQKLDVKNFPRCYIRSKGISIAPRVEQYNLPIQDILDIYDQGTYKKDVCDAMGLNEKTYRKNLGKLINYYKLAISKDELYKGCTFSFKDTSAYNNIKEFAEDAINSSYYLKKISINFDELLKMAELDQILLFQVYNKDYSEFSKGKPNIHTIYWNAVFDDYNLSLAGQPAEAMHKLNGGAQIYHRKASVKYKETHPKDQPINNKQIINNKITSTFNFPLIKDRRYTMSKTLFHCPITLNHKTRGFGKSYVGFNTIVNQAIRDEKVNYIGIDRGERHLLYYSVIDNKGNILEQNSFNILREEKDGTTWGVNYNQILTTIDNDRKEARKNWKTINQIKDTKSGYLSQVIHKIVLLMLKYNAIIVMENLNISFKRSRVRFEKQVYQNFEKALISKLNYLVLKDKKIDEVGGALKGYQLTYPIQTLDKVQSQNGVILYVNPAYTSKIDPTTGFVSKIHLKYENLDKAKKDFNLFKSFRFNPKEGYFELSFDYKDFGNIDMSKTDWVVCSYGAERYYYNKQTMKGELVDITQTLKGLLLSKHINISDGKDLKNQILISFEPSEYKTLFWAINILLALRYETSSGSLDQDDYILSPVKNSQDYFYDSRKANHNLPNNGDANGAYNIALKGLYSTRNMQDEKIESISNSEWFRLVQNRQWNKE